MLLCVPYLTPDGSEKFEEGLSRVEAGKGLESRSKEIEDGSCPQELVCVGGSEGRGGA